MADVGVNDLGVAERGKDALGAFLHDRGEQAVVCTENLNPDVVAMKSAKDRV
jgi:hypothetical protein